MVYWEKANGSYVVMEMKTKSDDSNSWYINADYLRTKNGKSIMDSVQTAEDAIQLMKTAEVEETQDYLYFQVVYNNLLLTKLMLMAGYELDYRMEEMMYDLARMNNIEMMKLLLAAGADPDVDDVTTTTSLINASKNGHINAVSLLLEYGADPDILDNDGKTALIYAEENGYTSIVDILAKSLNSANASDTSLTDDVEEGGRIAEATKTGAYGLDKFELLQALYEEATTGHINGIEYGVHESKDELYASWGEPDMLEGNIYHYNSCNCSVFIDNVIKYVAVEGKDVNLSELKTGDVVQALGEPMKEYIEGGTWEMYYEAGDYIFNIAFDFESDDPSKIPSNAFIAVSAP